MNQKAIFNFCKDIGCCDRCCFRYLGLKIPSAYENSDQYVLKFQDSLSSNTTEESTELKKDVTASNDEVAIINNVTELGETPAVCTHTQDDIIDNTDTDTVHDDNVADSNGHAPHKKRKLHPCVSCLGILQEDTWPDSNRMVKEILEKKRYECPTFACALSAPIATLVRERVITVLIAEIFPEYDPDALTALKEAWKWSCGTQLAAHAGLRLHSGAVSPLLLSLTYEYPDELQELEMLKTVAPAVFASRKQQRKRFAVEFTRRAAEQALAEATAGGLRAAGWAPPPPPPAPATAARAAAARAPLHLGGRYIKLSRELPQTPWLVNGVRMMESSVQEIIFGPIAAMYGLTPAESERRMKFMSAGREDVDVRCLGDGRPFAVEVTDPRRELTQEELKRVCEEISASGKVIVHQLVHVSREELSELKKGEETKCKTYEALCIKLGHSEYEHDKTSADPVTVTAQDIANINSYTNTDEPGVRVRLTQRTPIRVLHRRPLLTRARELYELTASPVHGQPALVALRVRASAGTYVKEWAHGELARTRPALGHALRAPLDILALDVAHVHLPWPAR
ncbi:putative tRNA pseudouridine synthase Pus10 [Achroia grisella]|uniref:putative tRNA pseudouridine synthase Pus10 n=1 Tax=Achroia grisella TaxID=688607 RepID=UPI0027D2910B|nr:putative tRNA pseudouridine synthase Pus10 [Achroia grisella]